MYSVHTKRSYEYYVPLVSLRKASGMMTVKVSMLDRFTINPIPFGNVARMELELLRDTE